MSVPQSSVDVSEGRASTSGLRGQFQRHPVRSAILLFLLDFVFVVVVEVLLKALAPQWDTALAALILNTVAVVALVTALGWWKYIGFNPPAQWRDLRLLWLAAAIIILPPVIGGFKPLDPSTLLYLVFGYVLTGITEESFNRGVLLRVLEPAGRKRAVVISAVLFGLLHLTNLLVRSSPAIVLAQAVGAFCDGFGFAVLRFRTNTIWFLVALHAIHDLLLQWTRLPAIPLDVAQVTLLLIYGIYLMRGRKLEGPVPA